MNVDLCVCRCLLHHSARGAGSHRARLRGGVLESGCGSALLKEIFEGDDEETGCYIWLVLFNYPHCSWNLCIFISVSCQRCFQIFSKAFPVSSRAHPDGDPPRADAQDHAPRLCSRAAGDATVGRQETGLSVSSAGQPAGAAQPLPVPPQGAARRVSAAGQRAQLCHP